MVVLLFQLCIFFVYIIFRFSQTKQVLVMEEDVDLEMIQERENAIKQLEVSK